MTNTVDGVNMNDVITEGSIPLPVSLSIKNQEGNRHQLTVYKTISDEVHETCFNFYGSESLNMRIEKKNLVIEIKKG
jgi:hypothetical protein